MTSRVGTTVPAKTVAIHQPNFFPWLGFFDKLASADTFVLLDNVQLETGRSWVSRVRLMINGEPRWATMPIVRPHGKLLLIGEVMIDDSQRWRSKLVRSLELNYAKAPHFQSMISVLEDLIQAPEGRLVDLNVRAIRVLTELLELRATLVLGSTVGGVGQATDRLVSLVRAVGGTTYLSGAGAVGYQEDTKFARAGLALVYQDFDHPTYDQQRKGPFVPGLSIIDVLMNWGPDAVRAFLATRRRQLKSVTLDEGR